MGRNTRIGGGGPIKLKPLIDGQKKRLVYAGKRGVRGAGTARRNA